MVLANQANASEIAVINLDEVIKNSKAIESANKILERKKSEIEKKLKVEEKKLSEEKESLEAKIKTFSQEVAQEKIVAYNQKLVEFQKMVRESEATLQKMSMEAVVEITNAIKTIVAEMKTEKNSKYNFDVVVPAASVIYSEKNLDISAEVLSRLNKKLKEVKSISK